MAVSAAPPVAVVLARRSPRRFAQRCAPREQVASCRTRSAKALGKQSSPNAAVGTAQLATLYAIKLEASMKSIILTMFTVLAITACATGELVRGNVQEGMTKPEVISLLGNPDGFQKNGDSEALMYTNRLISGWSWDRTDYTIILQNGRVVQYGTGQVRQNSPNTLILVPLR